MRREVLLWAVAAGAVVVAFGVTVLALNLTVYSASGFVRTYLDALARQDAPAALELAGRLPDGERDLLVREAMGELTDVEITADRTAADGTHFVTAQYVAGGEPGTTEFAVRREGTVFGLFNGWAFDQSPLSVLELTVQHDDQFAANGLDLIAAAGQDAVSDYLAFTPSAIVLTHETQYLTAEPVLAEIAVPGTAVGATLDVQANQAFVDEVQRQVDDFLTDCTTQRVLLPTGCPFGFTIDDRLVNEPTWSMVELPELTLEPGNAPETWRVPRASGIAHILVDVQSLFDGTVTTTDQDVNFFVSYDVTFIPGDVRITPNG